MTNKSFARVVLGLMLIAPAAGQTADNKGDSQQVFDSPSAAVQAFLRACKENDTPAMVRIFGPQYRDAIKNIDVAEEKEHRHHIWEQSQAYQKLMEKAADRAELVIGKELWPFPIPLVKESRGWVFATAEGFQEILARRIGENELNAIDVCRTFPIAQLEYAAEDRNGDEVRQYAQRLASTPGKHDGLYWEVSPDSGQPLSPMGPLVAEAEYRAEGAKPGEPYMGYYFKVLTRQGSNPPGGKYDYIINGHMIAGFALLAWPADYRHSGVKTFLISQQGKLFEKDLGPDTAKLAQEINEYNPDASWKAVATP